MRRDKHDEAIVAFRNSENEVGDAGRVKLASAGDHSLNPGVQWRYEGDSLNPTVQWQYVGDSLNPGV